MDSFNFLPPHQLNSTSTSLLRRASRHDDAAWRQLVDLYGPVVRYWIRGAGLPAADLPDAFQEVFLALSKNLAHFERDEGTAKFRAWLKTVTLNKVHDHFRRLGKQPQAMGGSTARLQLGEVADSGVAEPEVMSPGEAVAGGLLDPSLAHSEDAFLAQRTLHLVRQEFRDSTWRAFELTALEGLSSQEAATQLGISALAVRKAKSRILQRLKAALGEAGQNLLPGEPT